MDTGRLEAFSDGVFAVAITLLALNLAIGGPGPAALYQGVFEGMSISFTLLFWWAIRREHLRVALTAQQGRQATIRFGIGQLGYIAGIGLAFASAPASLALSGLVAVIYIFERTPAAPQLPGGQRQGDHDEHPGA